MIDALIAHVQQLPPGMKVAMVIVAMWVAAAFVLAPHIGTQLRDRRRDFSRAMLNADGSFKALDSVPQVRRRAHVSPQLQQIFETEREERHALRDSARFGGTRPPYGWEQETRRAGANTDNAALHQASACRHPLDVTNVPRFRGMVQ